MCLWEDLSCGNGWGRERENEGGDNFEGYGTVLEGCEGFGGEMVRI